MQGLNLPHGYHLEWDSDILTLFDDEGSPIAMFSAHGACAEEIEKTAEMEYLRRRGDERRWGTR